MKNILLGLVALISATASATSITFDLTSSDSVWYSYQDVTDGSVTNEYYSVDIGAFQSTASVGDVAHAYSYGDSYVESHGESFYASSTFEDLSMEFSSTPNFEFLQSLDSRNIATSIVMGAPAINRNFIDFNDPGLVDYGSETVQLQIQFDGFVEEFLGDDVLRTYVSFYQGYTIETESLTDSSQVGPLTEQDFWDGLLNSDGNQASLFETYNITQYLCTDFDCDLQVSENHSISSYGSVSAVNIPVPSPIFLMALPILWLKRKAKLIF